MNCWKNQFDLTLSLKRLSVSPLLYIDGIVSYTFTLPGQRVRSMRVARRGCCWNTRRTYGTTIMTIILRNSSNNNKLLPLLDLGLWKKNPLAFCAEFQRACHEIGFFLLRVPSNYVLYDSSYNNNIIMSNNNVKQQQQLHWHCRSHSKSPLAPCMKRGHFFNTFP